MSRCKELGAPSETGTDASNACVELKGCEACKRVWHDCEFEMELPIWTEPISKQSKMRRWTVPSSNPTRSTSTESLVFLSVEWKMASMDARELNTSSLNRELEEMSERQSRREKNK